MEAQDQIQKSKKERQQGGRIIPIKVSNVTDYSKGKNQFPDAGLTNKLARLRDHISSRRTEVIDMERKRESLD